MLRAYEGPARVLVGFDGSRTPPRAPAGIGERSSVTLSWCLFTPWTTPS